MSIVDEKDIILEAFETAEISFIERDGEIYLTAESIGIALEYKHPRKSVMNLFNNNRELLEPFAFGINLVTEAGVRETTVFNERGVYIIVMKSNQPKANGFVKWVSEVMVRLRKKQFVTVPDFVDPIDKEIYILEELKQVLLREKEMKQEITATQQEVFLLKKEFREYMPLSDSQIKIIRDGVKRVHEIFGFWIWSELRNKCEFSKLETTPNYKFMCIMRIINDVLNQTTLNGSFT